MTMLICGILLWSIVHLLPCAAPGVRAGLIAKLGEGPFKGMFALSILASVLLMVFGWRAAPQYVVYVADEWAQPVAMFTMLLAFILMAMSAMPTNVKQILRHPQLMGMLLWSYGHLLANGDNLSILLFGGLGVWAALAIVLINIRDGDWQKPEPVPALADLKPVAIGVVIYAVLVFAHPYLSGAAPFVG
jgi:uncharacterized membrane protein